MRARNFLFCCSLTGRPLFLRESGTWLTIVKISRGISRGCFFCPVDSETLTLEGFLWDQPRWTLYRAELYLDLCLCPSEESTDRSWTLEGDAEMAECEEWNYFRIPFEMRDFELKLSEVCLLRLLDFAMPLDFENPPRLPAFLASVVDSMEPPRLDLDRERPPPFFR